MNNFKTVDQFVDKHALLGPNETVIIGLSGGPDSVFLLHYLHAQQTALNLNLIAAHLDHEWRKDSAQDVLFCQDLCNQLQIPFESKKISELGISIKETGSKEQDARTARRFFFNEIAHTYNANSIALAQHKNDQEETFFIRLLRGASLSGLCGIWPRKDRYIRPLLAITKEEIVAWLNSHNITYLIDPTNISDDYLRNRIRNKLIPTLHEIDQRFSINFEKTINNLQETEQFLIRLTQQTFDAIAQFDDTLKHWKIYKQAFLELDPVMHYRILVHLMSLEKVPFTPSQSFLNELIRFIKQPESKAHNIHTSWQIIKKKHIFYINHQTKG